MLSEALRVRQRITDMGFYYKAMVEELGPFTVEDESAVEFDGQVAAKLGVDVQEILKARLLEI